MRKEFSEPVDYEKRFSDMDAWGLQTNVDIHDCDPQIIRDAGAIKDFVIQLCGLIKMKRFGEPVIVDFGEDERVSGYSMIQLIETSLVSAHFANQTNAVYLDIFSCKYYDPHMAAEFSREFFKGKSCNINVLFRK